MGEVKKVDAKTGFIGFFDILGYKSLLKNNPANKVAETVLPILAEVGNQTKSLFSELLKNVPNGDIIEQILSRIEYRMFSDTILILLQLRDGDHLAEEFQLFQWYCMTICSRMFEEGLPLRGAIEFGEYVYEDKCFAGKAIVEAYELSESLDIAACVLSPTAVKVLAEEYDFKISPLKPSQITGHQFIEYLVPLKTGEEKMYILNNLIFTEIIKLKIDARLYVMGSFWEHQKDIPLAVHSKIENTAKYFQYLMAKGYSIYNPDQK